MQSSKICLIFYVAKIYRTEAGSKGHDRSGLRSGCVSRIFAPISDTEYGLYQSTARYIASTDRRVRKVSVEGGKTMFEAVGNFLADQQCKVISSAKKTKLSGLARTKISVVPIFLSSHHSRPARHATKGKLSNSAAATCCRITMCVPIIDN